MRFFEWFSELSSTGKIALALLVVALLAMSASGAHFHEYEIHTSQLVEHFAHRLQP